MIKEVLKRGQISVNKKSLTDHCSAVSSVINNIDLIMKEKESVERGKKIAKEMNRLTFTNHTIQHFELNIPLKKLK